MDTKKTPIALVGCDMDLVDLVRNLSDLSLHGVIDPNPDVARPGLPYLGSDGDWPVIVKNEPELMACIGLDLPNVKANVVAQYGQDRIISVLSEDAYLAADAVVGRGAVVQRHVSIMTDVKIGRFCKINLGATLHHDCCVGDYCTIAPGARLLGAVTVQDGVFVGSNATVLPHVTIGEGAIIGAGAVVNRDVAPATTVVGVPARPIGKTAERL